jgi:hypothetical protein
LSMLARGLCPAGKYAQGQARGPLVKEGGGL